MSVRTDFAGTERRIVRRYMIVHDHEPD